MTDKRIDEILSTEEALVPSSGFAAAVMERIGEEAAAPPPIPFPWKRALPGFAVAAGVFGWTGFEFVRFIAASMTTMNRSALQQGAQLAAAVARPAEPAGWAVAALAVSLATWLLSRRLARLD